MPAMLDSDDGDPGGGEVNGDCTFSNVVWSPAERQYGIIYLMIARQAMQESQAKPAEVAHLKFVDSRLVNSAAPAPDKPDAPVSSDDESDDITDNEICEESRPVQWPGKKGSWWRVNSSLGEDLIVRDGIAISSSQLRRVQPGDLVQQAGPCRSLTSGKPRGCIRMPVRSSGWVTADASALGGPRYLVPASAPRWRNVYSTPNAREGEAIVIVRAGPTIESDEVAHLYYGDIVEQAGPSVTQSGGIVRMPVRAFLTRNEHGGDSPRNAGHGMSASAKVHGWVTVDASAANGPVYFKPVSDADSKRRSRGRRWT
mmetsp:Transcript_132341/g.247389  ORF Transcript_132341/g.247389 Transcript_132341/m.247389 type:complete len:313 (+) Transcript_132341:122-1060(+)